MKIFLIIISIITFTQIKKDVERYNFVKESERKYQETWEGRMSPCIWSDSIRGNDTTYINIIKK